MVCLQVRWPDFFAGNISVIVIFVINMITLKSLRSGSKVSLDPHYNVSPADIRHGKQSEQEQRRGDPTQPREPFLRASRSEYGLPHRVQHQLLAHGQLHDEQVGILQLDRSPLDRVTRGQWVSIPSKNVQTCDQIFDHRSTSRDPRALDLLANVEVVKSAQAWHVGRQCKVDCDDQRPQN